MKIVIGLGNPGNEYIRTRHNVGFEVIDCLADKLDVKLSSSSRLFGESAGVSLSRKKIVLLKPHTFMNNSGRSAVSALNWFKCRSSDLIVVLDDACLSVGNIRVRSGGSSAGHKGLQSIIDCLGDSDFPRVRIGIGGSGNMMNHVLSKFRKEEAGFIGEAVSKAAEAVEMIIRGDMQKAMDKFNRKEKKDQNEDMPGGAD
ncbi:MAG: aminoacyl-tRNA hydrolase [Candidatus Aureabacteria bacterium]|nr:aminoacyl-tRNA hydrolase [Candidatus Auribacterota bacterium]